METPENNTPANASDIQVTSAQQFLERRKAREEGALVTLPSGLVVRLGRPSVTKLVASDIIPGDAAAALANAQAGGKVDVKKLQELATIIAKQAIKEPVVSDNPDYEKGEVSIDDFDDEDIEFIVQYVQSGNQDIAKFRQLRSGSTAGLNL